MEKKCIEVTAAKAQMEVPREDGSRDGGKLLFCIEVLSMNKKDVFARLGDSYSLFRYTPTQLK